MRTEPIWVATFSGPKFEFDAYGSSEAQARDVLKQGLRIHAKQVGLADDWFEEYADDICAREVHIGEVYRDRSVL
jgi:hypothetical protein